MVEVQPPSYLFGRAFRTDLDHCSVAIEAQVARGGVAAAEHTPLAGRAVQPVDTWNIQFVGNENAWFLGARWRRAPDCRRRLDTIAVEELLDGVARLAAEHHLSGSPRFERGE